VKRTLVLILAFLFRLVARLRYHVTVKGDPSLLTRRGTLILANHPALLDPCLLTAHLWPRMKFHGVAADFLEQNSLVRKLFAWYGTMYVPGFEAGSNSYKRYHIEQAYQKIFAYLKQGGNVLVYPAGGLKISGLELLGGASGVHHILHHMPDVPILLVRTTGLWGSMFSKALTGTTPDIFGTLLRGIKIIFKNGIFFSPRRRITIEYEDVGSLFPRRGRRREMNAYLEAWFNRNGKEPLTLVSYSCWKTVLPVVQYHPEQVTVCLEDVPESVQIKVREQIAELASLPLEQILPDKDLAFDLGLDSLDRAQLVLFLKETFGVVGVTGGQLTHVASVMGLAAKLIPPELQENDELTFTTPEWEHTVGRPQVAYPQASTLIEGFLQTCDRMQDWVAAVDPTLGEVTYKKLKLAVIVFARILQRCEGDKIGILLPASIAANILILATQLAGKVPVMINWTLGKRNLRAVQEQTQLKTTISSWKFLDQLEHVSLDGFDEQIQTIEAIKRQISLKDKLHAWCLSRLSPKALLAAFGQQDLSSSSRAVILFTSGTESQPKGVPLTHANLMENQKAAISQITVYPEDALLSFLPSFHSFGFSVTGLLPLVAGWRVAFMPNPTQGRRLASTIERWKLTAVVAAPTFLRTILRGGEVEQFKTLRLVVVGAESCASSIISSLQEKAPQAKILEGYGITECAPMLTVNPQDGPHKGVGLPLKGVELKIVHPQTMHPVSRGEIGLILAKGPNVFEGYLKKTAVPPFVTVEGEDWYVTGDLGYLDQEGYLTLSGRLKRFVKIGGEMVSLGAIEHVLLDLLAHKGMESESPLLAVCSFEDPHAKSQLHVFSTLVLQKQELNDALKESGMSNLIRIVGVHQIPLMPLLGTGKIDYQTLHKQLEKTIVT